VTLSKPRVPVVNGLFTGDGANGRLLGGRCPRCGAYFFPKQYSFCRNPACGAPELEDVELSTRGKLWSVTDNRYAAPSPFPVVEPFEPYGVAAVELAEERMIVLGQVARGVDVASLHVGQDMELVVEDFFETDEVVHTVWKWCPAGRDRSDRDRPAGTDRSDYDRPVGPGTPGGRT
jgi:uncharacterized OB-fold protein